MLLGTPSPFWTFSPLVSFIIWGLCFWIWDDHPLLSFSLTFFISVVPWFPSSSPMLPLSFCSRPTSAATRSALGRYFEFKLSLTFLCCFAVADAVWLAHRSPRGCVAAGLAVPPASVPRVMPCDGSCAWCALLDRKAQVHHVLYLKINMLQGEHNSKKHLASQQMNRLVSFVQWHF